MISVILKIILYVLLAVVGILLLLLALRIGFSIKVCGNSRRIFVHAGFLKIDISRFTQKKRKNKVKKQSLAKYLEKNGKNNIAQGVSNFASNSEPQKNGSERELETKNAAKTENNVKSAVNTAAFETKTENAHPTGEVPGHKTPFGEKKRGQLSDNGKTGNNLTSFLEMFRKLPVCELLSLVKDTLSELKEPFSKYARLKIRKLDIVISTPDAANTAVVYGTASLAYQTLIDVCGGFKFFKIKRKNCGVCYDFSKTESTVLCDIKFTMAVWQIILCLLPVIKSYFKFRKISQKERNV